MTVHKAKFEDMALVAEIMVTSFRRAFADFASQETMDGCTNPDNCCTMLENVYQERKIPVPAGSTKRWAIVRQRSVR